MKTLIDTNVDAVKEEVVLYQNPLLFLKIWEIAVDSPPNLAPHPWNWHYHREVEFLAVSEGYLGVQTKHHYRILGPGDVMLLGSSQLHRTHKHQEEPLRYVVFQVDISQHFDPSTMPYLHSFSELTQPLEHLNYIYQDHPVAKLQTFELIMDIYNESQSKLRGYEIAISSSIKRLLLLLIRNDSQHMLQMSEDNGLLRLRPALEYIEAHLGEKIAVEDVCSLMNLSYHYFIKYFKRIMGLSFVDYVNYKRIKKAERLLLTRDLSIMEVSFEVGIMNIAQFYKLFKRHNRRSPKEFKLLMRSETNLEIV
jgi:YesN/AraC family two-component response regulator